jgi:hypothetical protein
MEGPWADIGGWLASETATLRIDPGSLSVGLWNFQDANLHLDPGHLHPC